MPLSSRPSRERARWPACESAPKSRSRSSVAAERGGRGAGTSTSRSSTCSTRSSSTTTTARIVRHAGGDREALKKQLERSSTSRSSRCRRTTLDPDALARRQRAPSAGPRSTCSRRAARKRSQGANVLVAHLRRARLVRRHACSSEQGVTRLDVVAYIAHGVSKVGGARVRGGRATSPATAQGDAAATARCEGPARGLHAQPQRGGGRGRASTRSSAAERGRADHPHPRAAEEEQPAPRRRRRRRQDGHRRGARARNPARARSRRRSRARQSTRSTWARSSPARATAATSRSGSRRSSRRSEKHRRRDPLHRRDPHHRRRRRDERRHDGRLEPAQARARLGQPALHRLDDVRGVSASHFEKDRALARRFQRVEVGEPSVEETMLDPQGPPAAVRGVPRGHLHGRSRRAAANARREVPPRPAPPRQGHRSPRRGRRRREACRELEHPTATSPRSTVVRRRDRARAHGADPAARRSRATTRRSCETSRRSCSGVIFGQDERDRAARLGHQALARGAAQPREAHRVLPLHRADRRRQDRGRQAARARCSASSFLRFDMSEYMERHTVSRLIGAPAGLRRASTRAASSPTPSRRRRTPCSSSTRSRRRTPTSSTCSSR